MYLTMYPYYKGWLEAMTLGCQFQEGGIRWGGNYKQEAI